MNYANYKILVPLSHHPNAVADDQIYMTAEDRKYIYDEFPNFIALKPYLIVEYVIDTVIIGVVCAATKEINPDTEEDNQ
jgi:hypothetical protein